MAKEIKSNHLRVVKSVPDPLVFYVRAHYNDHLALIDMINSGRASCFGGVIEAVNLGEGSNDRHRELLERLLQNNLDAILDPLTIKSATPSGYTPKQGELPWGKNRQHSHDDFLDIQGRRLIEALANFTIENGFTQVLAPTHLLKNANDPWLDIDIDSTIRLRDQLNKLNGSSVEIIYQLIIPYKAFRDAEQRRILLNSLKNKLPNSTISSVWLTISHVGRDCTANKVMNYITASQDFHSLGLPIVADHIGGVAGLALLAFNAVGGISHGVLLNERFNSLELLKERKKPSRFGQAKKVYFPAIDCYLGVEQARKLFESSTRSQSLFACADTTCCPRKQDMFDNHKRHFLYQRMSEVSSLSQLPETLRAQGLLDKHLRNTSDKALAASNLVLDDKDLSIKFQKARVRLDSYRTSLGLFAEKPPIKSFAMHPKTRAAR